MPSVNEKKQFRLFIFTFRGVIFDTDDGSGEDSSLANLLNEKYGNLRIEVRSDTEENALRDAIEQLTLASGFKVLDADYETQVS